MRESEVEKYLREQVEAHGGLCEKHVSPGRRGVPDRLISWDGGPMELVETKAPRKKPNVFQQRDHFRRSLRGHFVRVIDTKEKVDALIKERCGDE